MVIDTSAILAILFGEPEAEVFVVAVSQDPRRLVSAVSNLEAAIVSYSRKGPAGARELDILMHTAGMETVAMTEEQARLAREAYARFGRGGHPAGLNLGDCCSYALANISGEPLLFKGEDFTTTDVSRVF